MKTLVIGTAFILALTSSVPAAYGNVDGFNKKKSVTIPPARLTGEATRERLQVMQRCNTEVP